MPKLPPPLNSIASLIDFYHQSKQENQRYHLGCSVLGDPCERKIWLGFRWAVIQKFEGRILRLFRRGQNEESIVVSDLESIGIKLSNTGNDQAKVDFGCHIGGSVDGIIQGGYPGKEKSKAVLEIKTTSFCPDDVVYEGVETRPRLIPFNQ